MATSPDTTNYGRGFQTPGLGSAGAYQVSGFPYVTGSGATPLTAGATKEIIFPSVTKFITLMPVDKGGTSFTPLVSFADPSNPRVQSQGHTISFPIYSSTLGQPESPPFTFEIKCTRIWVTEVGSAAGNFTVVAGLTSINPGSMYNISGSGINE